jgi:outer membrane immunogenic protein
MKSILTFLLASALLSTGPAAAQSAWAGGYLGLEAGQSEFSGGDDAAILFDTNLDGSFGDTVRTAAGANAFSPGFCGGAAIGRTPGEGCSDDDRGDDYGIRLGYDWQVSSWVFGLLADYSVSDAEDSVSAFSTTPASYTMSREIENIAAVRARFGFSFGGDSNLIYATAGYARAQIENSFATTNAVNTFVNNGDSEADGPQYGAGYEHLFGEHFALGVEYLFSDLKDDEFRVRSQGPAPVTNPFILVNPAGTDFRRSDEDLELESLRLTLSYRF